MNKIALKEVVFTPLAVALSGSLALVVIGGFTEVTAVSSALILVAGFVAALAAIEYITRKSADLQDYDHE